LLGADIDVFCRRLRINYIFNGNEEDEDDDIGGPLVRNKSDWIPKPTKDKYYQFLLYVIHLHVHVTI
jgi:hypothetical protein